MNFLLAFSNLNLFLHARFVGDLAVNKHRLIIVKTMQMRWLLVQHRIVLPHKFAANDEWRRSFHHHVFCEMHHFG